LQTDAMARVKVGVGRPARGTSTEDFVLKPFSGDDLPVVRAALAVAVERLLALAEAGRRRGTAEDASPGSATG